jgi:hypothetical protein
MAQKADDSKWERRNLVRFAIAMSDVRVATETCDLMLVDRPDPVTDPRYWAYHTAIVNAYARPFTENKPLGKLPASVVKILTRGERDLHDQLLDDRKTASAHSDLTAKPVYFMPGGAKLEQTGQIADSGGFIISKTAWGFATWEAIKVLTLRVGAHVEGEAFWLLKEVYGDLYAPTMIRIEVD